MGGHWLALQGVAWVTMLVNNSKEGSLVEAVGKTFDGAHPCSLCKAVASGQDEEREQKENLVDASSKLNAVLVAGSPMPPLPSSKLHFFSLIENPRSIERDPASPPPWAV